MPYRNIFVANETVLKLRNRQLVADNGEIFTFPIEEFANVLLAILSSQHLPQTLILPWGLGPGMQSQRRENAKGGAFHGFDRIAPLPKYRPVHDPEH